MECIVLVSQWLREGNLSSDRILLCRVGVDAGFIRMIQRYFLVRVACCACNMFWWEISLCDDEESRFGCAEAKGEENRSLAEMVNAFNFSLLVYCGDTLKRMRSSMILDLMSGLLYQIQETCLMFAPQFKYGALCVLARLEMSCTCPEEVNIRQIPSRASSSIPSMPTQSLMVS